MKIKITIIFFIFFVIAVLCMGRIYFFKRNVDNTNKNVVDNTEQVEILKKAAGASAESNIYQIKKEYDGREILDIKPDIQFKTVLAGILKNREPLKEEAENMDFSVFYKGGIWVSESSREKFIKILKDCGLQNFNIDDEGYLYNTESSTNQYSAKLEELINSDELMIIDIKGTCYIRDEMTGEIVEYPFKDMDIKQVSEKFFSNNSKIIIITTNQVESHKILDEICN